MSTYRGPFTGYYDPRAWEAIPAATATPSEGRLPDGTWRTRDENPKSTPATGEEE